MLNRVILIGRVTKDVELRNTSNGTPVTSFTLAVNRRMSQDNQADFINCVAWNKTAELMAQYVKKGALISIEGRIQTRNYDNKDGQKVYVTEVVTDSVQFLESKSSREKQQDNYQQNSYQQNQNFSQGNNYQQNSYQQNQNSNQGNNDEDDSFDSLDMSNEDLPTTFY